MLPFEIGCCLFAKDQLGLAILAGVGPEKICLTFC